ncbi:Acyl-CoA dehydrogenase, short-chain specific [Zhongshania aliphaticivorans]|uniref:3-sulfinopropanoyl-CoA desulfinase n=1 Tax=Zhongshania aliphaticivorans TaxID=1470434 RepID=A0A5S9QJ34_9GAMM|nr:acyl-CoA dehydrogenase family protein [Zhongshania aliphaticivorans]CAA0110556.1 Acyl-CoA dehydrogenase, short-chain specific [Zhongshania aliphaticivorans]CAA0118183.1 Acyl-CoA dehydrogenase, short-chain specific [Zhongshania aliphaticivorans]CAA0122195.1 Acyl-CoA dehydrogenase, short-chain specific [Zhongshania aliphaticivorans]
MAYQIENPTRYADKMFSDVFLPDETLLIKREAREFAETVLRPIAHEVNTTPESRGAFRHDLVEKMAAAGLYAVPFAADVGGRDLQFPTLATLVVMEELGYYTPGAASALFDGQAILCGQTLNGAAPHLRERYLPKLIKGEIVCCFATSEPEASTDLSVKTMSTIAAPVDGGFLVNGRKRWITNSVAGDVICLLCNSGGQHVMLLVDMHDKGIRVSDPDLKMGNHAQLTADVFFEDVFVPEENIIGSFGKGLNAALAALTLGRAGIAALGVGMAQRAFDYSCSYISERKAFGKRIAEFQYWQFRFADHATAIENARNLYQKAAYAFDKTGKPSAMMPMAKVTGSELAVNVSRDAIQACGGYGFAREMVADGIEWPLESIYRDAKIGEIYEGANEVQRWAIAREIFGRDIAG